MTSAVAVGPAMKSRTAVALVTAALLGAAGWYLLSRGRPATPPRGAQPASLSEILAQPTFIPAGVVGVAEPSGIAYHAARDRLYVVGDEGRLAELDLDGRRLRTTIVGGDLEDVTVHTPSGQLLIVRERTDRLAVFDPSTFVEVKRWKLARAELVGRKTKGRREGFEGLAFRPDPARPGGGELLLAHQHRPPTVVRLALDLGLAPGASVTESSVIGRWQYPHGMQITALSYVPELGRYLLIDGHRRRMLVLDPEGRITAEHLLPGPQPEGLCFDRNGTLWIADDQLGLFRCPHALAALSDDLGGLERPKPPAGE